MSRPGRRTSRLRPGAPVLVLGLVSLLFASLGAYVLAQWQAPFRVTPEPVSFEAAWISPQGSGSATACFRRELRLPAGVRNAWLVVAARDAYEVLVNGDTVGRMHLWRPTRPFQNGLSEKGQLVSPLQPTLALNFPREYQWRAHRSWLLPTYLDITPHLAAGSNTLAVHVESRGEASVRLEGEIELTTGERVRIASDDGWHAEPVPPYGGGRHWATPAYDASDWRSAREVEGPGDRHLSPVPAGVYTTAFDVPWMRHPEADAAQSVVFESDWELSAAPRRAWLRLATNRAYHLLVNDRLATVARPRAPDHDAGDWIIGTQRAVDLPATPELLDPDEVGSLFAGSRFESPRHGDPTSGAFVRYENVLNRTRDKPRATNRSGLPGDYDVEQPERASGDTPAGAPVLPEARRPRSLTRDQAIGAFHAYDVTHMLRAGPNRITVRLVSPVGETDRVWAPQLAMDGMATGPGGARLPLPDREAWSAHIPTLDGRPTHAGPVATAGRAGAPVRLPARVFRGFAYDADEKGRAWGWRFLAAVALVGAGVTAAMRRGRPSAAVRDARARRLAVALLLPTVLMATAGMLSWSLKERDEILHTLDPGHWRTLLVAALALAGAAVAWLWRPAAAAKEARGDPRRLRALPWWCLVAAGLLLTFLVRAYALDLQPLDDDEYVSTQAVLAVAETGVPAFVPDPVWYTRSPLYHYLTGLIVRVFGQNLWALRLPSALFGVATAWLAWLCGAQLLRSRWLGLGALLLCAIHPFMVFTGHVARFYQQQQFFALLTVYAFCRGFVVGHSPRWRVVTLAALLCAVLSQELSAVLAVPLGLGALVFGKDLGWRDSLRLAVVAACVGALVVVDYAVFKTRCLTRLEGVSPNVEAGIAPHLWHPFNYLSLFLGYSRLHLFGSALFVLGAALAVRRRDRPAAALSFWVLGGVVLTNVLVTHVSLRYQYWLIPLWILVALWGLTGGVRLVAAWAAPATGAARAQRLAGCCAGIVFLGLCASWSPWRLPGSYGERLLGDATGAMRFVAANLRDGDRVMATEPHTHAGLLEAGRIDYDLSVPMLHDFLVLQDGQLVDRNGGAVAVDGLGALREAFARHERLWIVVNREKLRNRGKNIRWEYPGARVELFLRKNCQVAWRSYLWTVFLWDAGRGVYHDFRRGSV